MTALGRITADSFPPQGKLLGRKVRVVLNHKPPVLGGTLVRQDIAYPHVEIIQLDNGRFVLGTECDWRGTIDG